jgi:hypothetical protein
MGNTQGLPTISSKLKRIAELAKGDSTIQFTAIFHLIDMEMIGRMSTGWAHRRFQQTKPTLG